MTAVAVPEITGASQRLPLFPYQKEAVAAVHAALARGVTRQVISLPTGGGKTVVAVHLIHELKRQTVFMAHRDELIDQTVRRLADADPAMRLGVCKAERGREVTDLLGRDVIIASAQTLAYQSRLDTLCRALQPDALMIVDECHHSYADTWQRAIERIAPGVLIGLTATPKRGDGHGLDGLFDEIVYHLPLRTLVDIGRLARPIGMRIGTAVSLDSVHTRAGEFVESELAAVVNSTERNRLVVDAWRVHAHEAGRKRTVGFCADIAHAHALQAAFAATGVPCEVVLGSTPKEERDRIYRAFRTGALPVLLNVMVLTEGWDEPLADCALMCRPTKSESLYIQMAGRVLRHAPNKESALIIDFVDNTVKHSLASVATLAGDDTDALRKPKDGEEYDLFTEVHEGKARAERTAKVRAGADLIADMLGHAPVVWVEDRGRWFASTGNRDEWVSMLHTAEGWLPIILYRGVDGRYGFSRLFRPLEDAEAALNVAASRVTKNALNYRDARWRQTGASSGQLDALRRMNIKHNPSRLTKGEATELMDRAFFGRAFRLSGAQSLEEPLP